MGVQHDFNAEVLRREFHSREFHSLEISGRRVLYQLALIERRLADELDELAGAAEDEQSRELRDAAEGVRSAATRALAGMSA
jgi:hypothetical protein